MKTKKYKVELEVSVKKVLYVKAQNKAEAQYLAHCDFTEMVNKNSTHLVEGEYISSKVRKTSVVPENKSGFDFDIFGEDYGL